jgi:hypothetical protein
MSVFVMYGYQVGTYNIREICFEKRNGSLEYVKSSQNRRTKSRSRMTTLQENVNQNATNDQISLTSNMAVNRHPAGNDFTIISCISCEVELKPRHMKQG